MVLVIFAAALVFAALVLALVLVLVEAVLLDEVDVTAVTMVYVSLKCSASCVSDYIHLLRCI
jgi:hypothetical protein